MTPGHLLADRYRLDERIGSGGMGDVWRAFDTTLDRTVAVKILHAALARDATFRRRFTSEARTVAKLRTPGVVRLHDAREDADTDGDITAYLVMEYIPGPTLADVLDRHRHLTTAYTLRVVARIADALHAAHQAGIIHRDVKPGNVILGDNDEITLVDFGISHQYGDPGLTATGMVMGTTSYASPEQLRDEELTGQSDVYALGVLAYECLTGTTPFTGSTPAAVIAAHLYQPPPPLPPHVPEPVARLVMRCLEKEAARRPAGAAAVARECREFQDAPTVPIGVPVSVPPAAVAAKTTAMGAPGSAPAGAPARPPGAAVPPVVYTAPPKPRSRRPLTAGLVIALAVLLAGGVVAWRHWHKGPHRPSGANAAAGTSASPSPAGGAGTPIGPTLEPTPIVSAQNTKCLDLGANGYRTVDCGPDLFQDFTFDGRDGEYRIADEGGKCARLDEANPAGALVAGACDGLATWEPSWVRTDGGWDYWVFTYSGGDTTGYCLAVGENDQARGKKCSPDDARQQWRTRAV